MKDCRERMSANENAWGKIKIASAESDILMHFVSGLSPFLN